MQNNVFYSNNQTKLALFLLTLPLIFVGLAVLAANDVTQALDRSIFNFLQQARNGVFSAGWLIELARDVTALGSITVLSIIALAVTGYFLIQKRRAKAAFIVASVGGVFALSTLLKYSFNRARPGTELHLAEVFTSSFPSAHAMHSAAVYLLLGAILATEKVSRPCKNYILSTAILLTVGIGISRLFLGVHWPTDIVAGWTAGATWALLCCMVGFQLQKRTALG